MRKLFICILMAALGSLTTLPVYASFTGAVSGVRDREGEPDAGLTQVGISDTCPGGAFQLPSSLSCAAACVLIQSVKPDQPYIISVEEDRGQLRQGGVSQNGWLQVKGTQLCNEAGEPLSLRGMSSHGIQWFGQFVSSQAVSNTADHGANLFRAAMYTGEGGYLSQPEAIKAKVVEAVEAAIENDIYIIIDWHILSDGNPMSHMEEASAFFAEMSQRYRDTPNVLYEICNEPNGNVSWSGDIKPYARRIIQTIRENAPAAVILIGSPTWSQDIHLAAADPLEGENLMYTLHFYAGTHGSELRERIDSVLAQGLPVFVSEWGTSRADGSGGVFLDESKVWLDFLDERGISWCNWSLCDKAETSAALRPGTPPDIPWGQTELTESGQFVFDRFLQ